MIPQGVAENTALAAAGLACGFLNMVAGGGSLITLPVLMLLGLPAGVANGTNRLAIVSQSFTGATAFQRLGRYDRRGVTWVLTASAAGAAAGATIATMVPSSILRVVLLVAMIAMSLLILISPRMIGVAAASGEVSPRWDTHRALGIAGLFAAGLYGGFIQAGVGFILMAVLGGILRYDVLGTAALKALSTLVFGGIALTIFAAAGMVDWPVAALLALYTAVGALAGVRLAQRAPHGVLRVIAFSAAVATSVSALLAG